MHETSEFEEYLKTVQSMTLDCQMGGITRETYIANLASVVRNLEPPISGSPADLIEFIEEKGLFEELKSWLSGPMPKDIG